MIVLNRITFSYPGATKALFKDLSFSFKEGRFYLITGPSGAGKSSLLRLITHLESPDSGEILFQGKPVLSYDLPGIRNRILYIQQTPTSISGSVRENLLFPYAYKANKKKQVPDDQILLGAMNGFMLKDINLDDHVETLSVGQLQRICIIRGLLLDPQVLLLDEPTSALDPESRRIVEDSAENFIKGEKNTVIMISHQSVTPRRVTPVVLEVRDGRIKEVSS